MPQVTIVEEEPNKQKYQNTDNELIDSHHRHNNNNNNINNNQKERTWTEALQQNAFALPVVIAFLVIASAALVITLMAVNTDEAVDTVVDSLQDQVLGLVDSRFEQQLFQVMEITNGTNQELLRLNLPQPANDTYPYDTGYAEVFKIFDKNVNTYGAVDSSWMIFATGRSMGVAVERPLSLMSNIYFTDNWNGGSPIGYFHRYAPYNLSQLQNLNNANAGLTIPGFTGSRRPAWSVIDRSKPNNFAWIPPYQLQNTPALFMSVATTMYKDDGTFYGLCVTNLEITFLQEFFSSLKPTPNSVIFVLEPDNFEVMIGSSVGTLVNDKGGRIAIKESNITVLAAAGNAIADFRTVKSLTRATFKAHNQLWRLTAEPFTAYGNNFVLAVATPDDEFSKEVDKSTRNTIIICAVVTAVVICLIIFLSIQQHRLVQSSEQSVLVAKAVSSHLLEYDTNAAEETLNAASKPTFINHETGSEQNNYVNQNLVYTLRQIVENLMMYRPHLPDYVLPKKSDINNASCSMNLDSANLDNEDFDADLDTDLETIHDDRASARSGSVNSGTGAASSKKKFKKLVHHSRKSGGDDLAGGDPSNPFFTQAQRSRKSRDDTSNMSGSTQGGSKKKSPQTARISLLRDSGGYVERVVLGNLNLSRIPDVVFALTQGVKGPTVKYINRIIELILDNASNNDATVHSLVGDSLQVSWNGTQRTAHADVKACRFITKTEVALKKEISEWFKDPATAQQKSVVPIFNTRKALLTGGLAHGAAWCQLGGSATKQQFMMLNFSEQNRMKSAFELGVKFKFVSVCHVMNQNVQHEFLLRGAGLHVLPGGHVALFGSTGIDTSFNGSNAAPGGTDDAFMVSLDSAKGIAVENNSKKGMKSASSMENNDENSNNHNMHQQQEPPSGVSFVDSHQASATTGGENKSPSSNNNSNNNKKPNSRRGSMLITNPLLHSNNAPPPTLINDGKTFLAMPLFELVSRKKLTNADEWLYVVGDGSNANNKTAQTQVCAALSDAAMSLCRGNSEKAQLQLETAKKADEDCVGLGAYQSLELLARAIGKTQLQVHRSGGVDATSERK